MLSKILEHIVHQQVYEYLQQNNPITSDQLGFRPKLSMNIALTHYDTLLHHFTKTVTDLESQLNTDLQSVSHCLNNNVTITVQSKKIQREKPINILELLSGKISVGISMLTT